MSEQAAAADPFGQIADAFVEEYRQGRRPSVEEYASRFPEHADEIREILPTLVIMERAKSLSGSQGRETACAEDSAPLLGRELGDYRIVREIGRGGMGIVYEAEQLSLGRRVALKVLAQQAMLQSKQRRRFELEARAAARLHHSNIVPVFGVGEQEGLCYYAMQFIRGLGLDKVLEELKRVRHESEGCGPASRGELRVERRSTASAAAVAQSLLSGEYGRAELAENADAGEQEVRPGTSSAESRRESAADGAVETFTLSEESAAEPGRRPAADSSAGRVKTYWQSIARIGVQAAEALQYAHDQGVTHRDIKPSNLLLDQRGTVWVTDFGLAKSDDQQNLTHTGDILGTLRYLPPEAFDGRADARSDVYSLGLTLYELLTLRPAFDETDRHRLVKKVTTGEPLRIEHVNAEVPRDLATIVHKAIEREPADRYQSARQLAADLERFIRDEPIHARRASLVEQVRRWARRNRSLAAAVLGIASLLLVIAVGSSGAAIYFRRQEEIQRQLHREAGGLALRNQRLADENRRALAAALDTSRKLEVARVKAEKQEEVTRRHLYCAQMAVAHQSWQGHRGMLRTQSLLDDWRPQAGDQDLRGWEWYYIQSLCHRELAALGGHTDAITCVAYSPDGTRLASAARDGTIRIWSDQDREPSQVLVGHSGKVYSVCWSSDGNRLASAGDDGARIWDIERGAVTQTLAVGRRVFAVAFSPDDRLLALGIRAGLLELWRTANWERAHALAGHVADVYTETIHFSPDGTLLAAPGGKRVLIWSVATGKIVHALSGHSDSIQATAFSPDGARLASSSRDATIKIWDVQAGQLLHSLAGHSHGIASVAWHPHENKLASAAWDGTCRVWNLQSQQEIGLPRGHARHVFSVTWHPTGQRLATGGDDNLVKVWNPSLAHEFAKLVDSDDDVQSVSFSLDGSIMATGHAKGTVQLWNSATGAAIRRFDGNQSPIRCVAFHPRGEQVAAGGHDGQVSIWNCATGEPVRTLREHAAAAASVSWNRSGTRLVTTAEDGAITLWNAATGESLQEVQERSSGFAIARFSPDGSRLAAVGADGALRLWNLNSGQVQVLRGHTGFVLNVAWSANGERVATAGDDHTVRLWDAIGGGEQVVLTSHREDISSVDFSPDGRRLLSGDVRGTIKLWDVATGIETLTLRGPMGKLIAAGWSPGGQRIVANIDGKILAWDATAGYGLERDRVPTNRTSAPDPNSRLLSSP